MGAAGAAGGDALNVENVFSIDVYDGQGSNKTITNNIDLTGEGGLVWIKNRSSSAYRHALFDNERPYNYDTVMNKALSTHETRAETSWGYTVTANNNGHTLSASSTINNSGADYVNWTFRKAPKFFDIVTYTGNGTAGRTISHNLGSAPGCIIVKGTSSAGNWWVYHKDGQGAGSAGLGVLNSSAAFYGDSINDNYFGNGTSVVAPTSTVFTVGADDTNINGKVYVAYLFAHNDGDGEFGPTGDQDIIKCGVYTGNGTYLGGPVVDLGFEPQWLLIKNITSSDQPWRIADSMRGIETGTAGAYLSANLLNLETGSLGIELRTNGFQLMSNNQDLNFNGDEYIYIAIRRGPMGIPTSSSEVFAIDTSSSGEPWFTSGFNPGFVVDSALIGQVTGTDKWQWATRKTGDKYINTLSSSTGSSPAFGMFDYNDGYYGGLLNSDYQAWMCARAPGFFDVVSYKGDGSSGREIKHNLGAEPEMIIFKNLTYTYDQPILWNKWYGWNYSNPQANAAGFLWYMGSTNANASNVSDDLYASGATSSNQYIPTDTSFWVGNSRRSNRNGDTILALLFGSLDGVSKVGTYVGNGSTSQTIDCGFSNGVKLVWIKCADANSTAWALYDTTLGINAGSDFLIQTHSTAAGFTYQDTIDQDSSGFTVNNQGSAFYNLNTQYRHYIYYAIAA